MMFTSGRIGSLDAMVQAWGPYRGFSEGQEEFEEMIGELLKLWPPSERIR
jgi:hypothetical protein